MPPLDSSSRPLPKDSSIETARNAPLQFTLGPSYHQRRLSEIFSARRPLSAAIQPGPYVVLVARGRSDR